MKRSTPLIGSALVVTLLRLGAAVDGQAPAPPRQPQVPLNDQNLAQMLRDLGYPVQEHPLGAGRYWSIQFPQLGTGHPVTVEPDKDRAGAIVQFQVFAPLGKKINPNDPTLADKLTALNKSNTVSSRYTFTYFAKTGYVELHYAHKKPTSNPEEIREIFTRLAQILTDTRPLWRVPDAGGRAASPAPAPAAPPPARTVNLPGTTWSGTAWKTGDRGNITLTFLSGGETAEGTTWGRDGDKVVITFSNIIYRGTINGNVIAGDFVYRYLKDRLPETGTHLAIPAGDFRVKRIT
jgi:hypothetical protein